MVQPPKPPAEASARVHGLFGGDQDPLIHLTGPVKSSIEILLGFLRVLSRFGFVFNKVLD